MKNLWMLMLACHALSMGCGEAEEITLPSRPDRANFEEMQRTLLTIGCSADGTGCHAVLVGDFQVSSFPKAPADAEREFLLTKPFIDLEDGANSILLRSAFEGDPLAAGHPLCFSNADSCAYRRILAWIDYESDVDETMEEACPEADLIENACFNSET